jgi:CRISPR type I-E-associated protein CasB/Cse2
MPGDALLEPAFQDLIARLLPDKAERADVLRDRRLIAGLARVAVLLPHVRRIDQRKRLSAQLAEAMPLQRSPSGLRSPLRVQGLIREDDPDEAVARWRRLLPLIPSGVNVCDLARLVLHWSDEGRRNFAFHYFSAASLNAIEQA